MENEKLREYKKVFSTIIVYDNGIEISSGGSSRFLKKEHIGEVDVNWSGVIKIKPLHNAKEMVIHLNQKDIIAGEPKILADFLRGQMSVDEFKTKTTGVNITDNSTIHTDILKKKMAESNNKWTVFILLLLVAGILSPWVGITIWYLAILIGGIFYIWKKTKFDTGKKHVFTITLIFITIALISITSYTKRAPTITILEPENNTSIQADSISIKGEVRPSNSVLTLNGKVITTNNGIFVYEKALRGGNNNIQFVVKNPKSNKQNSVALSVIRILTDEEQEEFVKQKAEDEARIAEAEAKQKAEKERIEIKWKTSKAGRICAQNLSWTREECIKIADRKYWIGMHYDMLKYMRGLPNHVNESNYGSGAKYQVCWDDYSTSCFYFDAVDRKINSWN